VNNGQSCIAAKRFIVHESPAARDELFGPVAPIFVVGNAVRALELANATDFGLGASVWTRDGDEAARFTGGFDAGLVFVNEIVASDPLLQCEDRCHATGREV
jgi:succinate-semialdehyde dehydrogenase/glutarate-semialdehyde dehydrogenase